MFLAVSNRSDIAHAYSVLSQFNTCYNETHWQASKRVLRCLRGTKNHKLTFTKSGAILEGFLDADWGNDENGRRSYTGFVFKLGNGAVSWEPKNKGLLLFPV